MNPAPPPQRPTARGGVDVLRQLATEACTSLPRTLTVRTLSGGIHLYFGAPQEHRLGHSAGRLAGTLTREASAATPLIQDRSVQDGYIWWLTVPE